MDGAEGGRKDWRYLVAGRQGSEGRYQGVARGPPPHPGPRAGVLGAQVDGQVTTHGRCCQCSVTGLVVLCFWHHIVQILIFLLGAKGKI